MIISLMIITKSRRKHQGLTGWEADALAFDRKLPFILHHVFDTLHEYVVDIVTSRIINFMLHHMLGTLHEYDEYIIIYRVFLVPP